MTKSRLKKFSFDTKLHQNSVKHQKLSGQKHSSLYLFSILREYCNKKVRFFESEIFQTIKRDKTKKVETKKKQLGMFFQILVHH